MQFVCCTKDHIMLNMQERFTNFGRPRVELSAKDQMNFIIPSFFFIHGKHPLHLLHFNLKLSTFLQLQQVNSLFQDWGYLVTSI